MVAITSGTYNDTLQGMDIFDEAFELCRIDLKKVTSAHTISAYRSLTLMLAEWENRGIKQWKVQQYPITTTVGMQSFTLPSYAIDVVIGVYRRNRGSQPVTDTPMEKIGREEYRNLPDKSIQGDIPDRYFVDRQRDAPVIYFYTTPAIAGDIILLDVFEQTQDMGALSNNIDAPRRWLPAVCTGLAEKLSFKYAPEFTASLKQEAAMQFALARAEERDTASTRITPNYGGQAVSR